MLMKINIVYPKDNWILQKMGLELLEAKSDDIEIIGGQEVNNNADINYYINWCYWKILYPDLPKTKIDVVFFTHFDNKEYLPVLDKSDLIVCMSAHGRQELLKLGVTDNKINVCPYFGTSITTKKKIIIGTSGRIYKGGRKNKDELFRLQKDLNSNVFEFIHSNITNDKFFEEINYYLQTSIAEGGSMDILNAIYSRTPIISRNIGFFFGNSTPSDFIYESYDELLFYLKGFEQDFHNKDIITKEQTWDNFRKWHIDLFKDLQL